MLETDDINSKGIFFTFSEIFFLILEISFSSIKSDFDTAILSSEDGRHLVLMPHLERSIFPWNWGHYPEHRADEVSPWIYAFEDAYNWITSR